MTFGTEPGTGTVPARDLVVGHYVTGTPGQWSGAIGPVVLLVQRPGEVWAWLNTYPNGLAFERRPPDMMLNHGDPVRIAKHRA